MQKLTLVAMALGLSLTAPVQAETLSSYVEEGLGAAMKETSDLSDRALFGPLSAAQARLSDTILEKAGDADRYLEAQGLSMPEPGQQTGPLESVALKLTDIGCVAGETGFDGVRAMRDGAKGMAVTGFTLMAAMADSVWGSAGGTD